MVALAEFIAAAMGAVHTTEVQPSMPFTALNFLEHPVLGVVLSWRLKSLLDQSSFAFCIRQFGEVSSEHLPAFRRLVATVKQWLGTDACQPTLS